MVSMCRPVSCEPGILGNRFTPFGHQQEVPQLCRRRWRCYYQDMLKARSLLLLTMAISAALPAVAQDKSTGGFKGKVRVEVGTPVGVTVVVRQQEREVGRVVTDKSGEFTVNRLKPGLYAVTLRKPGLSVGTIENIEVRAGKTRSLGDRLVLTIDEGSIAFIKGSVFDPTGRSVPNVRVELFRIEADGNIKKIDGRVSNEIGSFVFRLTPDVARYRVTAKGKDSEPVSKDIEVDGAAVYRVALTINAK